MTPTEKLTRQVGRLLDRLEKFEADTLYSDRVPGLRDRINGLLTQLGLPPLDSPETNWGLSDGPAFDYNIPDGYDVVSGSPFIRSPNEAELGQQGFRFQITSPTPVRITHLGTAVFDTADFGPFSAPTTVTIHDENMDPIIGSSRPSIFDPTTRIGFTEFWEIDPIILQPYRTYTILQTVDKSERYMLKQDRSQQWTGERGQAMETINAIQQDDWLEIQAPVGIHQFTPLLPPEEAWPLSFTAQHYTSDGIDGGLVSVLGPNMLASPV